MTVDVVTYLFNFLAERLKHTTTTTIGNAEEIVSARDLRLRRLYIELIPPLLSVGTLIVVTVAAMRQAFETLTNGEIKAPQDQPDLAIMLAFSGLNLLLDILNVSCFARVDQAVGLLGHGTQQQQPHNNHTQYHHHHHHTPDDVPNNESTPLIIVRRTDSNCSSTSSSSTTDSTDATGTLNLNMCSAWTHVCADTLRSVAVLLASAVAYGMPTTTTQSHLKLTARQADSGAAIVVSMIILVSLVPLIQGLYLTACKIYDVWFLSGHHHHHDHDYHDHQHDDVVHNTAKLNV